MTNADESQRLIRTVIDAPLDSLSDPETFATLLSGGRPLGAQMAWVSRTLDVRMMMGMDHFGTKIDNGIRSSGEESGKLQIAANSLANQMFWLNVVMTALAVLGIVVSV